MHAIALTALTLTLGWALVRNGGVRSEDLLPCLLALAAIGALYWIRAGKPHPAPPLRLAPALLLFSLPALAALAIVPLPAALVRVLSPARYELDRAAASVTGRSGAMTLSAAPAAGFESLLTLLGCIVVFLLVRELAWRFDAHPWVAAAPLILLAALEAALGLAQVYADPQAAAHGTFVDRDHFADLLALCLPLPLCAGLAFLGRSRARARPVLGACTLFSIAATLLTAVVFSQSRMGFIASLFGLAVAGAAALGHRGKRAVPALLIASAVVFVLVPTNALIGRFADLASASEPAVDTRARLWRESLPLVRDYPLTGCGLGAYESVMTRYKTVGPLSTVDFVHNDYLQLLAEGGAVVFLPALALAAIVVATAVRKAARPRAYLAAACLGSLAALLLHSFFDFSLHIPADALAAAWVAGLAAAPD